MFSVSVLVGLPFPLRVTFLKSFLPLKEIEMDFRFSRKKRFTTCALR